MQSFHAGMTLVLLGIVGVCLANIEQVHVALTGKTTEMSIMYITKDIKPIVPNRFVVSYGYEPKNYTHFEPEFMSTKYQVGNMQEETHVHETILTKLKTASRVYYIVKDMATGFTTNEFTFTTAYPKVPKHEFPTFKFLTYGDMDTNSDSRQTLSLIERLLRDDKDIRFVIHQGDIPYAWRYALLTQLTCSESKWDQWGVMAEAVTANIPYMTTVGNHESDNNFISYRTRFTNTTGLNSKNSREGNLYYSFNYGGIHFVGLTSEHPYDMESYQFKWLVRDLSNVDRQITPFVILYAHRPMYCSNDNHGSSLEFREAIEPVLNEFKVDLFLYGHVHAYERTCPIIEQGKCTINDTKFYYNDLKGGTIHLVVGTAGYESNPHWDAQPAWSVFRKTVHGLMRITVQETNILYAEMIDSADDSVIDRFMIDKSVQPTSASKSKL